MENGKQRDAHNCEKDYLHECICRRNKYILEREWMHLNLMIRDINRINRENRFNNEGNINTCHIFLRKTFKKRYELLLYLINHDVKQEQRNRRNRETTYTVYYESNDTLKK